VVVEVVELDLTPISRIEGHLALKVKIENGFYTDAKVTGEMFRGFELLLKGKNLSLAPNIAGKICGVCGATHTLVSIEALEMLQGLYPTPRTVLFRNVAYALADIMYNNVVVTFIFQGIDFSSHQVPKNEYERGKETPCEYKDIHGFQKVSDIMDELYFGKSIFKDALKLQTDLRNLATLIWLRYPQPISMKPGSINIRDQEAINKIKKYLKEDKLIDKLLYVTAELREFYKGVYKDIGQNFVTYGLLEDYSYNADYEEMNKWADKRFIPPGLVKNGELVTGNLRDILLGVRIFTEGTSYDEWEKEYDKDLMGNQLDTHHPWNRETKLKSRENFIPKIVQIDFMPTTGDIARLYVYRVRKGKIRALGYEWEYRSNDVIERTFARMFTVALLKEYLLNVEEVKGDTNPLKGKPYWMAVGAHDAPRGANAHWVIGEGDKIKRYQIVTPTDRNFSPDGPVEQSIIGQKVTDLNRIDLDALRVVRSFDPCSACAVHVFKP
jgi:hydrogenase large subunit